MKVLQAGRRFDLGQVQVFENVSRYSKANDTISSVLACSTINSPYNAIESNCLDGFPPVCLKQFMNCPKCDLGHDRTVESLYLFGGPRHRCKAVAGLHVPKRTFLGNRI